MIIPILQTSCPLDIIRDATPAATYGLRRLKSGYKGAPIKVRDDTGAESEIPFCGQDLCEGTLTSWLNRNLVAGIPLGVDGNADGVSDGWQASTLSGITQVSSIDELSQKIEITNSTTTNRAAVRPSLDAPCAVGNAITASGKIKTTGNVKAMIKIDWYNGASYLGTNETTLTAYADFTAVTLTANAPASTTKYFLLFVITPNAIGDTGSAWFKDASVTISNQSAYLPIEYDQSGNGNHAVQTTAANQPRIVNRGIIDRDFDATKCAALYPTFASASGVNLVANGDFSNGTTGWVTAGQCTISASNNIGTVLGIASASQLITAYYSAIPVVVGKRYYVSMKVTSKSSGCSLLSCQLDGTTAGTNVAIQTVSNPVQNTVYTISAIGTVASDFTGNIKVYLSADFAESSGKSIEIKEVACIDVTDLGRPAPYFDGTNDVMTIANSASVDILGAPMTLNAVFNNNNQAGAVIAKNATDYATAQYALYYNSTNTAIDLYLEGTARQSVASTSIPINTQKVYSGTFENGVQKGYVNGANSGSDGNYNSTLTTRANMQIGARSNNAGGTAWASFFKGYIPETIIFSTALTDAQLQKLDANHKKYYGIGDALWTPASITTALWLDASDAATITQSGGLVSQWNDKSGNNNHATQGTGAYQPTYTASDAIMNNMPSIGSTDNTSFKGLKTPSVTAKMIYMVAYYKDGIDNSFDVNSTIIGGPLANSQYRVMGSASSANWIGTSSFNDSGSYKNGATSSSATVLPLPASQLKFISSVARTQVYALGFYNLNDNGDGNSYDRDWNGAYSEIIFTAGTEALATQQKLEGYLAHKWGLTANLPADHPYKNTAPRV